LKIPLLADESDLLSLEVKSISKNTIVRRFAVESYLLFEPGKCSFARVKLEVGTRRRH
jgi:hypothetical protein